MTFNVVMGSNQELKARASVEALAQLQVPTARVRRGGRVESVASTDLVPGDVVLLEAGDVVPADGRIVTSATLEIQEAALTGESAPVAKDSPDASCRARSRSATAPIWSSRTPRSPAGRPRSSSPRPASATQMGRIAGMVTATQRTRSPLQRNSTG